MRNEEVLQRVKKEDEYPTKKDNWTCHILRKKCLIEHVIEGKTQGSLEVTGTRGRRRKHLLDDLKEKKGYWKFKAEALYRALWRTRFGEGYRSFVRQLTEWMFDCSLDIFIYHQCHVV